MRKIKDSYKLFNLIANTAVTADLNGVGIDLEQYNSEGVVMVSTGLISSTVATYAINIQGSTALNGTYTTIGSFSTVGSGSDFGVALLEVNLDGADRKFIRAQIDATANGGTINGIFGVTLLAKLATEISDQNSSSVA